MEHSKHRAVFTGGSFTTVGRRDPWQGSSVFGWAACSRAVLSACLGTLACTPAPARIHAASDWERGADQQPSKSFTVARSPYLPKKLTPEQQALLGAVESTTKQELTRKGYYEVAPEAARLIVTSYFIERDRADIRQNRSACSVNTAYDPHSGSALPMGEDPPCLESVITEVQEGLLLIDFYDTQLERLVWHGWAAAKAPPPGTTRKPERVATATADILDNFPPSP